LKESKLIIKEKIDNRVKGVTSCSMSDKNKKKKENRQWLVVGA
jgi:hypothetical protein